MLTREEYRIQFPDASCSYEEYCQLFKLGELLMDAFLKGEYNG